MKLIRSALTTACLLATAWAIAAPSPVRMDGKILPQEFVGQMTKSERLKEYVAADETFERWTRLIGLRLQSVPQIGNDPLKMAQNMAALARRQYPDMPQPNIVPQKDGAIVQFYAYQAGKNGILEANVFRYWKRKEGLYSLQFARRVPLSSMNEASAKKLANQNIALIKEIADVDTRQVEKALMLR